MKPRRQGLTYWQVLLWFWGLCLAMQFIAWIATGGSW